MRIGVMLRDIWNQTDAPGIIVLNTIDKILEQDRKNQYVLFFRDDRFLDRYNKYNNARAIRLWAPNKFFWDQIAVPWAARRENVDLIFHPKHSIPLLSRRKTIMHLRGAEYWIFGEHFEALDLLYSKFFIPLFCRKATHLITESNNVKNEFKKYLGISNKKLSTIYLAPNVRFKVISDRKLLEACKEKYGLPDRFILTVTRVIQNRKYYPGKNILNGIEAFRRSKARGAMKFVIVGKETKNFIDKQFPANDEIRQELVALDFVPQEELPALYNLTDIFLFPSKYESFGIPILEAMACGCPVITSSTFSCPEVAGGAALLVDPTDLSDITAAINRLISNEELQASIRAKGLARASSFSWTRSASETIALFEKLQET